MNHRLITSVAASLAAMSINAQRLEYQLTNWKFANDDIPNAQSTTFDDSQWQSVQVPHDWAIYGNFDKEIDKQVVAIEQNGEKEATEHTGRTGSLPYIGTGWYRTTFTPSTKQQRTILAFQGVMSEPDVYLNGELVGGWKYGYTPFFVDITDKVKRGQANTIAVRATNIGESARWYPGAGIYRPVYVIETPSTAIDNWGISTHSDINGNNATLHVSANILNPQKGQKVKFTLFRGKRKVAETTSEIDTSVNIQMQVKKVQLWSPEQPELYRLVTTITNGKNIVDQQSDNIGFRTISYTRENGFQLNGQTRKIKGVCLHHDLGPIGTALNKAALIRQIKLLKSMGCDAIRTSHNIPPTWQMDICDSLGMMVMAESFDEWIYPKCKNGYHRFFVEYAEKDLAALVNCHKNHPSIIMWCIGNEIPEQGSKNGAEIVKRFTTLIHNLDPDKNRTVTSGCDRIDRAITSGFAQALDIPGMNYRTHKYQMAYDKTPQGLILGSETASTVSSRGVYKLPVVRADGKEYPDGQCSSYDQEACWWSNIPENDFELQDDKPWVIGEFVWTGFDYFGEPTPYDGYWPSRSSYFGIFDLAGLPKDRYYLYRSRWNPTEETIHILPHWNWDGHEGDTIPVYCYTNYNEAELFLNGVSQGRIKKNPDVLADRYRLRWNNVIYQPGTLKVVAYDKNGKPHIAEIHTANAPHHLQLDADRNEIKSDGTDLVYITVSMRDADNNICPLANDKLTFDVEGAAIFKGVCNGDATSLEPLTRPQMKLFNGQLVVVLQNNAKKGDIKLTVKSSEFKKSINIKAN